MTFTEFQATGRDVADLGTIPNCAAQDVTGPGRVYEGDLYIQCDAHGLWCLTISNSSILTTDLASAEATLYEWAIFEGYM